MATRRRSRRATLTNNLTDLQRRLRYIESQPSAYRLANQVLRRPNFQPKVVSTDQLADNGVTNAIIDTDAVTERNLATNSVTNDAVSDNAIDTGNIADGAVTTPKIADGAVTTPKLQMALLQHQKLHLKP
jgi:hypothetical protein